MKGLSSPVIWKPLFNYELKNLRNDFQIADFERVVNNRNVRNLKDAIMENKFYNNMISVTNPKKPWTVFDGQHRLQVLWLCYLEYKIKKYNLMLAIFPEEFGRLIYRRINMGVALKLKDHIKAMDDKKTPFFNELRTWLSHDPRPDKPLYVTMLQALAFARGATNLLSLRTLDDFIPSVTKTEIEYCKIFLSAILRHSPTIFGSIVYGVTVFRPAFRSSQKHKLTEDQVIKLLVILKQDKLVKELSVTRQRTDIVRIYERIESVLLKEILQK